MSKGKNYFLSIVAILACEVFVGCSEDESKLSKALIDAGWFMPYHYFATWRNGLAVYSRYRVTSRAEVVYASGLYSDHRPVKIQLGQ